jgi:hypothetical protein
MSASEFSTEGKLNASSTGAILHLDEDPPVPDEDKAIFYAQAGLTVCCPSLERWAFAK